VTVSGHACIRRPVLKLDAISVDSTEQFKGRMTIRMRHTAALGLVAIAACFAAPCAQASASEEVAPLPSSDYSVEGVCSAPSPGHAACLALQLVPVTPEARAHTHPLGVTRSQAHSPTALTPAQNGYGLSPQDLHGAYQLPTTAGSSQTIALVDAYNDPSAEEDLKAYEHEFGTECAGCFSKVNQNGQSGNLPFPGTARELEEAAASGNPREEKAAEEASGWSVEISLDIETARAICENCHILLVEANSSTYEDLEAAEGTAESLGATDISNSWGGSENGETEALERSSPFNAPGIVITASAGDDGYLSWGAKPPAERGYAEFPASSPDVVAVGGTRLTLAANSSEWSEETVWNGDGAGGGGCSVEFAAPIWQRRLADWQEVGCGEDRSVADISADADPYTGVAVHDSNADCLSHGEEREQRERDEDKTPVASGENVHHWCTIGGTSLASPLIASTFALAGGANGIEHPAETLYENAIETPGSLHDIVVGSNGDCTKGFNAETGVSACTPNEEAKASCPTRLVSCLAHAGYDGPTGLGTPDGIQAFEPLTPEARRALAEAEAKAEAEERARAEAKADEEAKIKAEAKAKEEKAREEAKVTEEAKAVEARRLAGSPSVAPSPSTVTPVVQTTPPPTLRISTLTLTLKALLALDSNSPKLSQVGFAFTINASARVNVTLEKRTRTHGHVRWVLVRRAATTSAAAGRNTRNLSGGARLKSGSYRLTLTPAHAAARSITFQIG
jgi:hypothetical protein